MRTAVVRVGVDPGAELDDARLRASQAALEELAAAAGVRVVRADLVAQRRRELQLLVAGEDAEAVGRTATALCEQAFGAVPRLGTVTWISRGSDEDALGVLAGMGLAGRITRIAGDRGWDALEVELAEADLDRVPESRVQTALEAATNCEIRIVVTGSPLP